jgi:hypothetical protein
MYSQLLKQWPYRNLCLNPLAATIPVSCLSPRLLNIGQIDPQSQGVHEQPKSPLMVRLVMVADFLFNDARQAQYNAHDGSLCHAQPRFSMYSNIDIGNRIPVFFPPLQSDPITGADADPGAYPLHP